MDVPLVFWRTAAADAVRFVTSLLRVVTDAFLFLACSFGIWSKIVTPASIYYRMANTVKFTAVIESIDGFVHVVKATELQQFSRLWIDSPTVWPAHTYWMTEDEDVMCKILKIDSN
jgi:hypothetical protein